MDTRSREDVSRFDARTTRARIAGTPLPAADAPASEGAAEAPSQAEAEAAVRTLIRWAGDDPDREGLLDTPARVARSYSELFAGYEVDPRDYLKRTFDEVGGYDELVVMRDIRFVSFCEHHMLPYRRPRSCRLSAVQAGGRHFQAGAGGERLCPAAADPGEDDRRHRRRCIQEVLQPQGVGVVIEAEHSCMTLRGVNSPGSSLTTSHLLGVVRDDARTREEFLRLTQAK